MFYKTINQLLHKSFNLRQSPEILRRLFFNSKIMTLG